MREGSIQKQVFAEIRKRGTPGSYCFHVPNHKKGRRASGFTPGIPDIVCVRDGIFFAIELKADKGTASEEQLLAIDNIRNAGGHAVVCHGRDLAVACLETWGILRKAA
jgi:hypothetical protein